MRVSRYTGTTKIGVADHFLQQYDNSRCTLADCFCRLHNWRGRYLPTHRYRSLELVVCLSEYGTTKLRAGVVVRAADQSERRLCCRYRKRTFVTHGAAQTLVASENPCRLRKNDVLVFVLNSAVQEPSKQVNTASGHPATARSLSIKSQLCARFARVAAVHLTAGSRQKCVAYAAWKVSTPL